MEEVQKLKQKLDINGIKYVPATEIGIKDLSDRVPFEIPQEVIELLCAIGTCTLKEDVCLLGLDVDRPMDDICLRYLIFTNNPLYSKQLLPLVRHSDKYVTIDCTTGDLSLVKVERHEILSSPIDVNIIEYLTELLT